MVAERSGLDLSNVIARPDRSARSIAAAIPTHGARQFCRSKTLAPEGEHEFMTVGKFRGILGKAAERVTLAPDARLTFEIGPPELPMQVFDVDTLHFDTNGTVLRLAPRVAICKPRHRAV